MYGDKRWLLCVHTGRPFGINEEFLLYQLGTGGTQVPGNYGYPMTHIDEDCDTANVYFENNWVSGSYSKGCASLLPDDYDKGEI